MIVEKKEWKEASELIKIKSRNPKTASSRTNRDRDQERRRVVDENRKNKRRTVETNSRYSNTKPVTKNSRPGGSKKSKFNGEEYFTFSLDGLIPAYGDPSQVSDSYGHSP